MVPKAPIQAAKPLPLVLVERRVFFRGERLDPGPVKAPRPAVGLFKVVEVAAVPVGVELPSIWKRPA